MSKKVPFAIQEKNAFDHLKDCIKHVDIHSKVSKGELIPKIKPLPKAKIVEELQRDAITGIQQQALKKKVNHFNDLANNYNDNINQKQFLMDENLSLQAQNERLMEERNQFLYTTLQQEHQELEKRREDAENAKKIALDHRDHSTVVEVDKILNKTQKELDKLEGSLALYGETVESNKSELLEKARMYQQIKIDDWLQLNPEVNPRSSYFNPALNAHLQSYVAEYQDLLVKNNMGDVIGTDLYYNDINTKLRELKDFHFQQSKDELNNKLSSMINDNVARVKKSSDRERWNRQVVLTSDEKKLARALKVPEALFLKNKIIEMRGA